MADLTADQLVVSQVFTAQYPGNCKVCDARYKVGVKVGKLEREDNPFIPVTGVACPRCLRDIPRKVT
jgi:hypothetical protein